MTRRCSGICGICCRSDTPGMRGFAVAVSRRSGPLDIARTLDMPINTVKSHLKRSLDSLREKTCEDHPT